MDALPVLAAARLRHRRPTTATSRSVASRVDDWPASSARRCSSTTRPTSGTAAGRRSGRFGDGDVIYATKAFLCRAMARLAHDEGLWLDVATGGELHVALAAGVPADRLVLHGNNKSTSELRRALDVGVGRIVVDSFDELDRIESLVARGCAEAVGAAAGHPGRRGPHPRVRPHRPGSTRSSGSRCRPVRPRSGRPRRGERLGRPGRAPHAHRVAGLRRRQLPVRRSRAVAPFVTALGLPELFVGGGLGVAYVEGEEAPTIAAWGSAIVDGCRETRGSTASVVGRARAGRSPPARRSPLYTVGTVKDIPGVRTYVVGRRRHERQPAAGPVRQRLRDVPAPRRRGPTARCRSASSASTASRATCWCARRIVPGDLAVGDLLATPVTGAYGHSMGSNYNKVASSAGRVRGRRRGPPGRAARDDRRPARHRRRLTTRGRRRHGPRERRSSERSSRFLRATGSVGRRGTNGDDRSCLGCGNVGAALLQLIDERADEIAARTGLRLRVGRVAVRSLSKERDVALPAGLAHHRRRTRSCTTRTSTWSSR